MKTRIALFRGVNVVGKNLLPMQELRRLLEGLGLRNVKTYIQSGNAVFQHTGRSAAMLATKIQAAVEKSFGFSPEVFMLELEDLISAIESNPFPKAVSTPSQLHLTFLSSAPKNPDLDALRRVKSPSERFALVDNVFYLHAPDGIGRSKLAARIEKALGAAGTSRNWRTIAKLKEMAEQAE